MRLRSCLLAFALFTSSLCASEPITITPKVDIAANRLGQITIKAAGKVKYWADPALDVFREAHDGDANEVRLRLFGPTGSYKILAWTAVDNNPTDAVICTVTVGGGTPAPPVPPTPVPPQPTPPAPITAQKLFMLIIEESEDARTNRAAYVTDAGLVARMKERGHLYRLIDQNIKPVTPDVAPYLQRAAGKPLPRLFLIKQTNGLLWEGDLPATPAELVTLLAKYGG